MATDDATNQVVDEESSAPGVADQGAAPNGDDQATDQTADELDPDDPDNQELADDETEEIEFEGVKFAAPKAVKAALEQGVMRQADYTRKTQEVAETRKALETERQTFAQQVEAQQTTLEERAALKAVEAQLSQYAQLDWTNLAAQGEGVVAQTMAHMRQLESARDTLKSEISKKEDEHRLTSERARATAIQQADIELSRELKGYGPELVQAVAKTAGDYGFSPQELRESLIGMDGKPDLRSFKVLAELKELREYKAANEAKQTKAQQAAKQAAVQPAKTVAPRGKPFAAGLDDSLPPDEWLRRRQAQLAKR